MSNPSEGLETGPEQDVNSDAGFVAALARAAEVEIPEGQLEAVESQDRDVSRGLSTEESPQRDALGRFAPVAQEEAAPDKEEDAGDPALSEYLQRHGGDAQAALAAAIREKTEAQSLIGRQGSELGDLRAQLARFEGRLEQLSSAPQAAPLPPVADSSVIEGLEELYRTQGAQGMMTWIAYNRPDLVEAAEEIWASDDPLAASRFTSKRIAFEMQSRAPQPQAPQPDPFLDKLRLQSQFDSAIAEIRGSVDANTWGLLREHLPSAFESAPKLVKSAVLSVNDEERHEGMSALVDRAWRLAGENAARQERDQRAAEIKQEKQRAQVATGSLRPVNERQPVTSQEASHEERIKAFHEALMKTETTSVADGLTFADR